MSLNSKIHNTIIKATNNVNYILCSTVYDLIKGMSLDSYTRSVIEFFGYSKIIIDMTHVVFSGSYSTSNSIKEKKQDFATFLALWKTSKNQDIMGIFLICWSSFMN